MLQYCRSKGELYWQGRVLQRGVGELCSTEPRDKTLLCHSYFLALTSTITFIYRLMIYACLISLIECLPLSTSLLEHLCFTYYHLLALVILITLLLSCSSLRLVLRS